MCHYTPNVLQLYVREVSGQQCVDVSHMKKCEPNEQPVLCYDKEKIETH